MSNPTVKPHPEIRWTSSANGTMVRARTAYEQRIQIVVHLTSGDILTFQTDQFIINDSYLNFITQNEQGEDSIERYFPIANVVRFQTQAVRG